MTQVAQIARFVAKQGEHERLLAAIDEASVAAAQESGTLLYISHVDHADERTVWVYELYDSEEARAAHLASEATTRLRAAVADVVIEPISVTRARPRRTVGVPVG